jgi:hypothetical protein
LTAGRDPVEGIDSGREEEGRAVVGRAADVVPEGLRWLVVAAGFLPSVLLD